MGGRRPATRGGRAAEGVGVVSRLPVRSTLRILWVAWLLVAVVCLLALIGAMPTDADPLDVRRTPLPDRCCTERPTP